MLGAPGAKEAFSSTESRARLRGWLHGALQTRGLSAPRLNHPELLGLELVSSAAEAGVWGRGGEWQEITGRAARGTDCHVLIL